MDRVTNRHQEPAVGHSAADDNDDRMDPTVARQLWLHLETVNAVTYFSAECREAPAEAGLQGFWMGYFGCRAAPLGAVAAAVVEATFYNFHPDRVGRAIPDAWSRVSPERLLEVRRSAAATALRRVLGSGTAETLAEAVLPSLRRAMAHADGAGRPLFAANRERFVADESADPVEALWQACTTLREQRGDGHVALLAGAGLDGCEVHVLCAADEGIDPEVFQASRGWSDDDWHAAADRLATRGLVAAGGLTDDGRRLRADIEQRTDVLAAAPYTCLDRRDLDAVLAAFAAPARTVASAGEIRYPNPMALPAFDP